MPPVRVCFIILKNYAKLSNLLIKCLWHENYKKTVVYYKF